MSDAATLPDGFAYYDDKTAVLPKGFTYFEETATTVEDGFTYIAGVVFFTFLLDD